MQPSSRPKIALKRVAFASLAAVWLIAQSAQAVLPSGITYHGRLLMADGVTPVTGVVTFDIQIKSPDSSNCILYEETQSQNLTGNNGVFALTINDGSGTRTDAMPQLAIDDVFSNRIAINHSCSGGPYTPSTGDGRILKVTFQNASMAMAEPMPDQMLNFAPFAIESKQISGFAAENILRFQNSDTSLFNTSPLNNAQYDELVRLVNGTSTQYAASPNATNGSVLETISSGGSGNVTSPTTGSFWLDTTSGSGVLKYYDGSSIKSVGIGGSSVTSIATGSGLTGGPITTSGTISVASGGINSAHLNPAINIATTGYVSAHSLAVSNTQATPDTIGIYAPAAAFTNYTLVLPTSAGTSGQVLRTDGTGNLSWTDAAAGALTSTHIFVGNASNVATDVAMTGDVGISNSGATTVKGLQGVGISTTAPLDGQVLVFSNGANNWQPQNFSIGSLRTAIGGTQFANANCLASQTLTWSSLTDTFTCTTISGLDASVISSGTVPMSHLPASLGDWANNGSNISNTNAGNVGIGTTAPSQKLEVNGTAQFDSGVIASGMYPQANSTTALKFNKADGTTNVLDIDTTNSRVGIGTTAPAYPLDVAGVIRSSVGGVMFPDGTTQTTAASGASNTFIQNGNAFGTSAILGTTDSNALGFVTAGSRRVTIDTSGNVGIGTTVPNAKFDVAVVGSGVVKSGAFRGNPGSAGSTNYNQIIFDNTYGAGNFKNEFAFASNGTAKWSFGNDANGAGAQNFYIYDGAAGLTRLFIDAGGGVQTGSGGALGFNSSVNPVAGSIDSGISRLAPGVVAVGNGSSGNTGGTLIASNVGIGTTAPVDALSIGTAPVASATRALVNLTNTPLAGASASGTYIGANPAAASADFMNYQVAGTTKFAVDKNGKITGDGSGLSGVVAGTSSLGTLTAASTPNTIDNLNYAQAWNWSTASTQNPLTFTANALTTGSILSLTSSYASGNSTNGLLYVANTGAGMSGTVARIQSNSTAGSGITVLANGNVGIGTTAPAYPLDVAGQIRTSTGGYVFPDGTTQTTAAVGAGTTSPWATYGSNIANINSGNVGIGTTAPGGTLDVEGGTASATNTNGLPINLVAQSGNGNAVGGNINLVAGGGNWGNGSTIVSAPLNAVNSVLQVVRSANDNYVPVGGTNLPNTSVFLQNNNYSDGASSLIGFNTRNSAPLSQNAYFGAVAESGAANYGSTLVWGQRTSSGYAERMRLSPNGNVGIGTTAPAYKLDVAGGIRSSSLGFTFPDGTTQTTAAIGAGTTSPWTQSGSSIYPTTLTNFVGAGTSAPAAPLHAAADTVSSNGTTYAILAGNKSTPTSRVEIGFDGSKDAGVIQGDHEGFGAANLNLNSEGGITTIGNPSVATPTVLRGSDGYQMNIGNATPNSWDLGRLADGTFRFASHGSSDTMILTNTGRVGIGTTAPAYKLDVAGQVNSSTGFSIAGVPISASGSGIWSLNGANAYNTNSGNVGIGTSTPLRALDITAGSAAAGLVRLQNTNSTGYSSIFYVDSAGTTQGSAGYSNTGAANYSGTMHFGSAASTSTPVALIANGTEAMRILPNGNIGIGTTAPTRALSVVANSSAGVFNLQNTNSSGYTSFDMIDSAGTQQGGLGFGNSGATAPFAGALYVATGGTTPFTVIAGGAERVRVASTGNVGVGTSTPAYKLDVNGSLNATSLYVNGVAVGTGSSSPWTTYGSNIANNNSGNVGIGTTTPAMSLSVNSKNSVDGIQLTGQSLYGYNDGTGMTLTLGSNTAGIKQLMLGDPDYLASSGGFFHRMGVFNGFPFFDVLRGDHNTFGTLNLGRAGGSKVAIGAVYGSDPSPGAQFWVNGGSSFGTDYQATVPPANGLVVEGNVGIGTTAPAYKIDVNGAVNASSVQSPTYTSVSSDLAVQPGAVANSAGHTLFLTGGSASTDGYDSGGVAISAGSLGWMYGTGNGGGITLTTGNGGGTGNGGDLNLSAGWGNGGGRHGGNINLTAGTGPNGGYNGNIVLDASTGGASYSGNVTIRSNASTGYTALIGGNVGIGTTAPGQALEVNGNVLAAAYLYSSDQRLKTNITPIDHALSDVVTLNGVRYDWRKPASPEQERRQIGVIAQDVEKVFPEAVVTDKSGLKRVNYPSLVAPLIEAIKELWSQLTDQSAQIEALKTQNHELNSRLEHLEKLICARNPGDCDAPESGH